MYTQQYIASIILDVIGREWKGGILDLAYKIAKARQLPLKSITQERVLAGLDYLQRHEAIRYERVYDGVIRIRKILFESVEG